MDFKDLYLRPSDKAFDISSISSSDSRESLLGFIESPPYVVTFPRPKSLYPLHTYIPDDKGSGKELLHHYRRSSDPQAYPVTEYKTISTWKWILVFFGLSIGAFLAGLNTTILAEAQGPILQNLGEIEKVAWIGAADPLGSGATILLIGSCYGLFQIKYMYLFCILTFEIGSAICGVSASMNAMILGRITAGIGGAGIYLGALNYLYTFTAPRTRPIYNAILGISFGIGKILGPVIGEAFANTPAIGWRWSFYINLPLTGIMAPLFLFLLPKHNPMPSISTLQKLKLIDFLGFILNTLVWASFLVAITMGGSNWVWSSVSSMAVWTLFGTSLLLYIIQQSFCFFTSPNHRIFPVHFLRSQALMLLFVATAATMAAFVIPIFYIPLPYRFAHEFSPMNSANYLIPFISAYFLVILSTGVMLLKIGYYKAIYLLASTFMISGGTLMTHVTINTSSKMVCLYSILISIEVGMSFQTAYDVGMSKVSREAQIPAASDVGMIKELVADEQKFIAYINVAQAGCAGIAPGIAGCVYQNLGVFKLQKVFGDELPVEVMRGALGGLKGGGSESLGSVGEEIMGRALDVVVETMASVYWLVVAAGVAIAICGMGMKWERILLEPEVERNRRRSVNYEAIVY